MPWISQSVRKDGTLNGLISDLGGLHDKQLFRATFLMLCAICAISFPVSELGDPPCK